VLAVFNSTRKLTRRFVQAVARIMAAMPDATLWLVADNDTARANLLAHLPSLGIDRDRLVLAGRVKLTEHLNRATLATLALDSFDYSGGITTMHTLLAGVPVVALPGRSMVSRMSASILTAAGLASLVAGDVDDFVGTAVALARDQGRLTALRRHVAATIRSSPLFDTAGYVRHLEQAYTIAVARAREGRPFEDIRIE
jgi:protein O-GlcNAc transferase